MALCLLPFSRFYNCCLTAALPFRLPSRAQECGLVAQAHIIDERSEWRTFGDKDKESEDPNRVGGPSNPLLDSAALSTMIGRGTRGDGGLAYQLNRMHNRASTQDRALLNAFKEIKGLCQRMDLNDNIRDHAQKVSREGSASHCLALQHFSMLSGICYIGNLS